MLRPETEPDLAEAIRGAAGPLCIVGGGTRGIAAPGEVLETGALRGIVLHEPEALTLVARAGTPLAEIEAALAAEGQRLAFEPPDWRRLLGTGGEPTLGGAAAMNLSGPRRMQAGACRDSLLGVRFVDGTGAVVKNGGRVMKNVTGYDLVKLMAGSHGTLGVLTELSLRVQPAPPATVTLVIAADLPAGVAALTAALASPYDVSGAAWLPGPGALVRLEGLPGSVAYRAGELRRHLAPHGQIRQEDDPHRSHACWQAVRDVAPFHGRAGDVWRLSLRPSEAAAVAARLGGEVLLDWGGGLLWALLPPGADARLLAGPFTGHATRIRGAAGLPRFQPESAAVAALSAGLRARFDPRGILNPGLMG